MPEYRSVEIIHEITLATDYVIQIGIERSIELSEDFSTIMNRRALNLVISMPSLHSPIIYKGTDYGRKTEPQEIKIPIEYARGFLYHLNRTEELF